MNDQLRPLLASWRERQQASWRAGQPLWIETLLEQHPGLCLQDDPLLDLVYGEVCAREAAGDYAAADEYLERFPHLSVPIRRLFEVHEYIRASATSPGQRSTTMCD